MTSFSTQVVAPRSVLAPRGAVIIKPGVAAQRLPRVGGPPSFSTPQGLHRRLRNPLGVLGILAPRPGVAAARQPRAGCEAPVGHVGTGLPGDENRTTLILVEWRLWPTPTPMIGEIADVRVSCQGKGRRWTRTDADRDVLNNLRSSACIRGLSLHSPNRERFPEDSGRHKPFAPNALNFLLALLAAAPFYGKCPAAILRFKSDGICGILPLRNFAK